MPAVNYEQPQYDFYTGFNEHKSAKESVLDEATRITTGPRRESYGHPTPNHTAIAALWQAFLDNRVTLGLAGPLTPQEAATMMALLKIARLQFTPDHRDSIVDAISYLALVDVMNANS